MIARIVSKGFSSAMRPTITLELEKPLEGNLEGPVDITIEPHREKRTLTQNSYYWHLIGKVAEELGVGRSWLHNRMVIEYGVPVEDDDGNSVLVRLPDTERTAAMIANANDIHYADANLPDENGLRWYRMFYGSRYYNTAEMARMIDGLIEAAQALGIETLTPDKLERMRTNEERKIQQREGQAG